MNHAGRAVVALVGLAGLCGLAAAQVYSTVAPPLPERAQARSDVNLRAGPGTGHAVVGKVARGGWLDLRECDQTPGWCEVVVAAPGRAWVSASHVARAGGLRADTGAPTHIEVPPPPGPPVVIVLDGVRGPRR